MATYADLRKKNGGGNGNGRPIVTLTGAGVAAILVALPGLVTLMRGEPKAQETFEYLKKSSAVLVANQQKQHDRMIKLEATMDAYALVRREQKEDVMQKLLLLMTGAIASRHLQPKKVSTLSVLKPIVRRGSAPLRCRRGYTEEEGRCMKVKDALIAKDVKKASLNYARLKALKAKRHAEEALRRARDARNMAQRPASAPLPDKLSE